MASSSSQSKERYYVNIGQLSHKAVKTMDKQKKLFFKLKMANYLLCKSDFILLCNTESNLIKSCVRVFGQVKSIVEQGVKYLKSWDLLTCPGVKLDSTYKKDSESVVDYNLPLKRQGNFMVHQYIASRICFIVFTVDQTLPQVQFWTTNIKKIQISWNKFREGQQSMIIRLEAYDTKLTDQD